jgi:two-component system response regulator HydG
MSKSKMNTAKARVLIVDDELSMAEMIADDLIARGYDAVTEKSARRAARLLEDGSVDVLITDLRMPEMDGLELLAIARKFQPSRPVIVMTAYSAIDTAIESIRRGAYHYLTKPFKMDELAIFLARSLEEASLRRETISLKRALRENFAIGNLVGQSAAMREIASIVDRVADADVPVLILGETGTGKGVIARAIHAQGARSNGPFVSINCASLPENLLESELFGHAKGAFTGATTARAGLFAEASGGTLLLDEIGEMSPALQAKLLHVVETGTVRAVGDTRERSVDVRILAATHRDLRARIQSGAFREDLLYRLEVVTIDLPPLRLRRDDLTALVAHFLERAREKHSSSPVEQLSPDVYAAFLAHSWPGNVRELEHVVERLVVLGRGKIVSVDELPVPVRQHEGDAFTFNGPVLPMREVQRRYAAWAYEQLAGRKLVTAETLGIDDKTLAKWLSRGDP